MIYIAMCTLTMNINRIQDGRTQLRGFGGLDTIATSKKKQYKQRELELSKCKVSQI